MVKFLFILIVPSLNIDGKMVMGRTEGGIFATMKCISTLILILILLNVKVLL